MHGLRRILVPSSLPWACSIPRWRPTTCNTASLVVTTVGLRRFVKGDAREKKHPLRRLPPNDKPPEFMEDVAKVIIQKKQTDKKLWNLASTNAPSSGNKNQVASSIARTKKMDGEESKPIIGVNKMFRAIPIDSQIMDYIEKNQFGKRKPTRKLANNSKKAVKALKLTRGGASVPSKLLEEMATKEREELDRADHFFLKMHRLRLRVSASDPSHFPPDKEVHEIAAFGRSNVGKSSLINALADTTIVKASDKPGETQQVSWYDLGSKMALVDLPGYGFAYADEEKIANWKAVTKEYLSNRKSLKRVLVLIDSRHGIKYSDKEIFAFLDSVKATYQVVLTKSDLVTPADLARRASVIKRALSDTSEYRYAMSELLIVSSRTRLGIPALRRHLLGLAKVNFTDIKPANETSLEKLERELIEKRQSRETTVQVSLPPSSAPPGRQSRNKSGSRAKIELRGHARPDARAIQQDDRQRRGRSKDEERAAERAKRAAREAPMRPGVRLESRSQRAERDARMDRSASRTHKQR